MLSAHQSAETHLGFSRGDLILAVDTGGTKTAAWLVEIVDDQEHRRLAQARTSAGNPLSVGFEKAAQAIHEAITAVRQLANCGDRQIARAVLSIAGAANHQMAQRFADWAVSARVSNRVAIVSDVLPILAAGSPDCCGVALIAGTGSSAFGRAADGPAKRCGGWGYLLGDEGSGYAIGRAALQHTLRVLEAGLPTHGLAESMLSALGASNVTELTRTIYGSADSRRAIAAFTPIVAGAAERGDPIACEIFADAAAALAELTARTASTVGLTDTNFSLAISGGVLINSRRLQQLVQAELDQRGLKCAANVVSEPLVGCVRLAHPEFAGALVEWHDA
jgi:glucosamine kinase